MCIAGWVGLTVNIVHIHHEQIFVFVSDFLISLFQILIRRFQKQTCLQAGPTSPTSPW